MFGKVILAAWSLAGLTWWIIAWCLVRANERQVPLLPVHASRESITVFKPLPPLEADGMAPFAGGLRSFADQLDAGDQLLVGVHEKDRACADAFFAQLVATHERARIDVVYRRESDTLANPKIAWQVVLAPHAVHALWLWSDADIVASAGALHAMVAELEPTFRLVTCPYAVRRVPQAAALLETLFVNAEFLPGVLLLRRLGPADFGLGAGMLFRRDDFASRVKWEELGASLADDFHLGQRLQPVRISHVTLETRADDTNWKQAFAHDLRWSKTVRWTRPAGSIARICVLPVTGWLIAVALHLHQGWPWIGLALMVQIDALAAWALCRATGCRLGALPVLMLEGWGLWRVALWILCWLPGRVRWNRRSWAAGQAK